MVHVLFRKVYFNKIPIFKIRMWIWNLYEHWTLDALSPTPTWNTWVFLCLVCALCVCTHGICMSRVCFVLSCVICVTPKCIYISCIFWNNSRIFINHARATHEQTWTQTQAHVGKMVVNKNHRLPPSPSISSSAHSFDRNECMNNRVNAFAARTHAYAYLRLHLRWSALNFRAQPIAYCCKNKQIHRTFENILFANRSFLSFLRFVCYSICMVRTVQTEQG